MDLRITKKRVHDLNDPKRVFGRGEVLRVNDPERAKRMLERGLAEESKAGKFDHELDTVQAEETVVKDPVSEPDTEPKKKPKRKAAKPSD